MRPELRIIEGAWSLVLVARRDATPAEHASALAHAGKHLDSWFPERIGEGFRSRARLLFLCDLLDEPLSVRSGPTRLLKERVRQALEQGRLLALPVERLRPVARPRQPGPRPSVSASAGAPEHEPRLTLHLSRLYHDDAAVQLAPFWVELEGGETVEGKLDTEGRAVVSDLQTRPRRVRFGPDARRYRLVDDTPNPAYDESFDADALVARRYGGNGGEPGGA